MGNCRGCKKKKNGKSSCFCASSGISCDVNALFPFIDPQGTGALLNFQNEVNSPITGVATWLGNGTITHLSDWYFESCDPNNPTEQCQEDLSIVQTNFANTFIPTAGAILDQINGNVECFPEVLQAQFPSLYATYQAIKSDPSSQPMDAFCSFWAVGSPNCIDFFVAILMMTSFTSSFIPTNTPQAASGTLLNQQQTAFFNAMQLWPANLCIQDCTSTAVTTFQNTTGPALNGAFALIEQNLVICYTTDQIEQFRSLDTQLQSLLTGTPSGSDICNYFNVVTDTTKAFNYQFMLNLTSCPG